MLPRKRRRIATRSFDGVDLIPFLSGKNEAPPHKSLFWRVGDRRALRSGDWKIVRHGRGENPNQWELYDLETDIDESDDLSKSKPEQLRKLIAEWESVNAEMVDPLWK